LQSPKKTIGILAVTQVASWGSLYYAFAVLAPGIGHTLALAPSLVFGAFAWSLLVAGLAATPVGMLIDRFGGRWVLACGSLLCALGLAWLGRCTGPASYYGAWTVIGLAMALSLYEAAFATLNRKLYDGARQAISTLTLFGGFASTLAWPLTARLEALLGWRDTYLCYALFQLAVCLPLHLLLGRDPALPASRHKGAGGNGQTLAEAVRQPVFWKLALAFSANTFIFSAMSVHLIALLRQLGQPAGMAVFLATLVGPMQVAGRIGEMTVGRDVAPRTVGTFTFAALPAGLLLLLLFGTHAWLAAAFCVLYGLSNGILTIVRGTIPQALFGRGNYGAISGALAAPSLLTKAAGPLAAAALLERWGTPLALLAVLFAMSVVSLLFYLAAVRAETATAAPAGAAFDKPRAGGYSSFVK
jgi:MFS family permease